MLKSKLAIILLCFWFIAGCQQSLQSGASRGFYSSNCKGDLSDSAVKKATSKSMSASNEKNHSGTPSAVSPENASRSASSIAKEIPEKQEEPSDIFAQQKIDEALELCNSAQEMWEEGKIEDALSNLDSAFTAIVEIDTETYPDFYQQKEDVRYLISKRILEIYASRKTVAKGLHNEIPRILNNFVQDEINSLTGPERNFFIQSLERSSRYRPYIISEFKKAGIPEEISWLPLIESGYKLRALSPARALGLWQFIPSTGYKYGLNRNYYIDERMDPEKATRAAIGYLKELHGLFGDWTTALAAYNCGEGRVLSTIRQQKINYLDNFWDLYQQLPRETARYVPRFLATLHIVSNLEKYQITLEQPLSPIAFRVCEINNQVKLSDIAEEIGVDAAILQDLNPELRYALLPDQKYSLRVPEEKADLFIAKADSIKSTYSASSASYSHTTHRVQKKDTLSSIAEKYKTTPEAILAANNLSKIQKVSVGRKLKIPNDTDEKDNGIKTASAKVQKPETGKSVQKYTVQRGDNLFAIAEKFNTTTKEIIAANKLNGTALTVGQNLTFATPVSAKQILQTKPKEAPPISKYKVKDGDTLASVAKKHKISVDKLLALNNLNKKSKISMGQDLIVE